MWLERSCRIEEKKEAKIVEIRRSKLVRCGGEGFGKTLWNEQDP